MAPLMRLENMFLTMLIMIEISKSLTQGRCKHLSMIGIGMGKVITKMI